MKVDELLISAKELPWQKPISPAVTALEIYHQLTWDREGSHLFVVVQNTVYQDPGNFPIKTGVHAAEPFSGFLSRITRSASFTVSSDFWRESFLGTISPPLIDDVGCLGQATTNLYATSRG